MRADRAAGLLLTAFFVTACGSSPTYDSAPAPRTSTARKLPPDPVPKKEPRSRYGNGPRYEVFGRTYQVMDSSYGYRERGVASWYGKKFHGRPTSSQEPYDMYEMTAAHKTLPLPTYVRVRNLKNNRQIVVRVNDRGPFVDNRLIDLSYSAAVKLDMVRDGTTLVEVTAISFDEPPPREQRARAEPAREEPGDGLFVQVGAFGDAGNARKRFLALKREGIGPVFVHEDRGSKGPLYRVRIGPIANVGQYDSIVQELQKIGITEAHLVSSTD